MVGAQALNPAIKFAGVGMQALKPSRCGVCGVTSDCFSRSAAS